jgi:hypothetical protein
MGSKILSWVLGSKRPLSGRLVAFAFALGLIWRTDDAAHFVPATVVSSQGVLPMNPNPSRSYDPRTFKALTFHDSTPRFREGTDSPRAYLERCIEMI